MAASEAKLGMVWCWLQHQKETRTRGAASPRSASPMGPAPTRLPRMALPLLNACLSLGEAPVSASRRATSFLRAPSLAAVTSLQQQAQRDNAHEPQDPTRDSDPVEVSLDYRRRPE